MNALYGRFGLNPESEKVVIVTAEESERIILDKNNVRVTPLSSGKVMIFYEEDTDSLNINNISVTISSAIAAYSRVTMSHFMVKYNKDLYYIDTDGIKLSTELDKNEVDDKELGKFKEEYTFTEAAFPGPKFYGGKILNPDTNQIKEFVKVKGLKNSIPYPVLKSIINKDTKFSIIQEKWIRDLEHYTILVKNQSYTLALAEHKRKIVFDSLGNFIDSIPLQLNNGELVKTCTDIIHYLPLPK